MSDLPGHDHDPDPAALDELQRAFSGDEHTDDRSGRRADRGTQEPADARAGDRSGRRGGRGTQEPADAPADARAGDRSGRRADRGTHESADAPVDDRPGRRGGRGTREPADARADEADGARGAATPTPDVAASIVTVDDLDGDDPASVGEFDEPVDDGSGPVDVVIVEQDHDQPSDVGPDEPSPRVIRIDGYHGSTDIRHDDATPETLRDTSPEPADAPADGADDGAVISIGDDDLPDAVYVEGSLDSDGSGTIVFIEDDDTSDALGPESERELRRGIEPRMRERRVAVKRAQGRRRLKWVLVAAGVVAVIVAVLAVLGSPLFAVREGDVEVFGARYADGQRLDEIIDDAVGTPVLRLDTERVESDIEAIPWVDEASVSVDFPHGLVIDIREREAWTTYRGPDGRFRVLDREGRVLDVLDLYPYAYVLIGGPDPVDLEPGEFAPQGYVAASELAKNLTGSMRGRVTGIEVTADGSRLVVNLDDGSAVMFGEARDLLAKLVRLESVLTNGQEREPGLIDVSTADVTR